MRVQTAEVVEGTRLREGKAEFILGVQCCGVELAGRLHDRVGNVVVVLPFDLGADRNCDGAGTEGETIDADLRLAGCCECTVDGAAYRRARRECAEAVISQRHVRAPFWLTRTAMMPSRGIRPEFPSRRTGKGERWRA